MYSNVLKSDATKNDFFSLQSHYPNRSHLWSNFLGQIYMYQLSGKHSEAPEVVHKSIQQNSVAELSGFLVRAF